jgi:hypothetical protein
MSEVLARIRVKEEHGIRRFLYPLSAEFSLPSGTDLQSLGLATTYGEVIPLQVAELSMGRYRLDFAVHLGTHRELELELREGQPGKSIEDPLQISTNGDTLSSKQQLLEMVLSPKGKISNVIYDGVRHLAAPIEVSGGGDTDDRRFLQGLIYSEETPMNLHDVHVTHGGGPITAWLQTKGRYASGCLATVDTEITACKSWAKVMCRLEDPAPETGVIFTIPFAIESRVVTYDCGLGGGVYGKLEYETDAATVSIHWKRDEHNYAEWRINHAPFVSIRLGNSNPNYAGYTANAEDFQAQRWFHLIDKDKAIAVAITRVPETWKRLKVRMSHTSGILIECVLDETAIPVAEFGICYHFLNDIPAIAAATNPQSILLPPTVEVLPT